MPKKKKTFYVYIPPKEEYFTNSNFKLEIKPSLIKGAGKGVFTLNNIPKETFIDEYIGDRTYHTYCGDYFLFFDDGTGIDAQSFPRCYMAMLNDAYKSHFENNCYFKILSDKAEVWSLRDIQSGEELLISYGDEYWQS